MVDAGQYKTDPGTGDVLPVVRPGHHRCVEALRYALEDTFTEKVGYIFSGNEADHGGIAADSFGS